MLHLPLPPPSPTSSSVSSSDLDTESTGSFFHDRSITLGTLMGVTFPSSAAAVAGPPSSNQLRPTHQFSNPAAHAMDPNCNSRKQRRAAAAERRRRRWWWDLCRDAEDAKPASSLGEFLEVERRYGSDAAFFNAEVELGGRALFADGRVLPPAEVAVVGADGGGGGASSSASVRGSLSRFSVSLTGICCGGAG